MTVDSSSSNLTDEFQKRKKEKSRPYGALNAGEQDMARLLIANLLTATIEEVQGTSASQYILNFLGLRDMNEFQTWQTTARESGRSPQEIARTLDYGKSDFASSENALLELIAQHEARGDYNMIYGGGRRDLTSMTINEVLQWQKSYVDNGSPSSAAGRYQFVQDTLRGLKKELGLTGNELFNEEMQDRLATVLLERRGYSRFLRGEISEAQFMRNLSKEWASLPKDMGGKSYYHGDGLNQALTSPQSVLAAMHAARGKFENNQAPARVADNNDDPGQAATTLGTKFSKAGTTTPALAFGAPPDPNADRSSKPPELNRV